MLGPIGSGIGKPPRYVEGPEGHTVVTILCDSAHRYASKMFNVDFLESKGLPAPTWLEDRPAAPGDDVDGALARVLLGGAT